MACRAPRPLPLGRPLEARAPLVTVLVDAPARERGSAPLVAPSSSKRRPGRGEAPRLSRRPRRSAGPGERRRAACRCPRRSADPGERRRAACRAVLVQAPARERGSAPLAAVLVEAPTHERKRRSAYARKIVNGARQVTIVLGTGHPKLHFDKQFVISLRYPANPLGGETVETAALTSVSAAVRATFWRAELPTPRLS